MGRIAAAGERVVLVTRTGRHAVLAYGLTYEGGDRFGQSFRTLVVPPLAMPAIGLTGGSYDTFGLVGAQFAVHLAVGPEGLIYVGVRYPEISPRSLVRAHQNTFGETLATDPDGLDSYVTRLSAGGVRLGTSVVKIPATGDELEPHDELQSLHAVPGAVWLAGRTELWNPQGTGHDVLLARIDGGSGAVQSWRIDLDRGDIAFGVVPLDTTRFVIVGAQGYTQNPQGASVSEAATGFARVWSPTAGLGASLPVPSGPRHNQTRLALPLAGGRLLLGGMIDGPGTHSADGDIGKLRADGYLVTGP
ncbi:MAG: hypothetical protein KA712_20260 [Myxococcales bacterium]|nr:hypothetical protein [Myxococcales bacterium]